jgi:hypothetical protein
MSKDATATVYARMIGDPEFRGALSANVLSRFELTEDERRVLLEEAASGSSAANFSSSGVMRHLRGAPALSPRVASDLGAALNKALGLPTASLQEPGFRAPSNCCPWGHPKIPDPLGMIE